MNTSMLLRPSDRIEIAPHLGMCRKKNFFNITFWLKYQRAITIMPYPSFGHCRRHRCHLWTVTPTGCLCNLRQVGDWELPDRSSHTVFDRNSFCFSFFFRRPTSDMNIASGCPLFCQLSQIDQAVPAYVKDDTMFLKIIVDPAES